MYGGCITRVVNKYTNIWIGTLSPFNQSPVKPMSRRRLLEYLAVQSREHPTEPASGMGIGEHRFGVTAIADHLGTELDNVLLWVQQLIDDGLPLVIATGDRTITITIADVPQPLVHSTIQHALAPMKVTLESDIDSTNSYVLDRLRDDAVSNELQSGWLVTTEVQSVGRGTRGRRWLAPGWQNLFLTVAAVLKAQPVQLSGLSLAAGSVVADVIEEQVGATVTLKWPNDVLINEKKVAGILIETVPIGPGLLGVALGVGVNVDLRKAATSAQHAYPVTDLRSWDQSIDRQALLIHLAKRLNSLLTNYPISGFSHFRQAYLKRDVLYGRRITVDLPARTLSGRAKGVDDDGCLVVSGGDGDEVVVSGSVHGWRRD